MRLPDQPYIHVARHVAVWLLLSDVLPVDALTLILPACLLLPPALPSPPPSSSPVLPPYSCTALNKGLYVLPAVLLTLVFPVCLFSPLSWPLLCAPPPCSAPQQCYSPEMKDFMVKVVQRSGLSQKGTYLPPAIHPEHAAEVRGTS